jgi:hypothetical protein
MRRLARLIYIAFISKKNSKMDRQSADASAKKKQTQILNFFRTHSLGQGLPSLEV